MRCLKNDPPAKDIIAGGYWIKSGFQNEFGFLGLVFPDELDLRIFWIWTWFFWTNWTFRFSGFGRLISFWILDSVSGSGLWLSRYWLFA